MPTNHEVGIRWSEEKYATKDEVREVYNMAMIDNIWNQIVDYRRLYTKALELHNIDRSAYMVVVTQAILLKVNAIERRLSKILVKTHDMNPQGKAKFVRQRLTKTVDVLEKTYNTGLTEDMISHLVADDLSTVPSQYSLIYNYLRTTKYYLSGHYLDLIDFRLLEMVNLKLLGQEADPLTLDKSYRLEEIETSHYYQNNYVYKAAPIERIPDMVDELCVFLRESDLSPIVKAIIANYYLDYIKPFDYLGEATNALFTKVILGHFDFEEAALYLDFESISFRDSQKLQDIKTECQKTLDLTYYVNYVLDCLEDNLNDILDDITLVERSNIMDERVSLSEDEKREIGIKDDDKSQVTIPLNFATQVEEKTPYVGEANVALPVFPAGLKETDVDTIVTNLLEVYPYLKRTQAHFYARHCTIGKHYTIGQFKEEEDVAYETARTSMDFLAENGFYAKTKVRNKFVYSPIPRR